jgi:4,5-dihydroxyphthalate decarboxylase
LSSPSTSPTLSLAIWDYDRVAAVLDGRVRPAGVELQPVVLPPESTFFRMLRHREFDVAEMSLSSYVLSLFDDEPPFVAIPVFPSRVFRHSGVYVPSSSSATDGRDLVGGTVGIPEYQMTAAVWIRGILADHHGLPVDGVEYRTGGLHEAGRTEKLPLRLPDRIRVQSIGPGETLAELLAEGRLDAVYTARAPRTFGGADPKVRRLFVDHRAVEQDYFRATGIFPIMHTVVLRREVHERHPWVARSLVDAFAEAKRIAMADLAEITALKSLLPWGPAEAEATAALMGSDFWPYGLDANRTTLETFLRYSHDQGLAGRVLRPEDLFAPETLDELHV